MSKHNRQRKAPFGSVRDPEMLALSNKMDARVDRQWLRDHPGVPGRQRPATVLEMAALNLPAGTMVTVFLFPDGCLIRGFAPPAEMEPSSC